jgi:hypothetical protein
MRRKKDDKRVLRPGNGQQKNSRNRRIRRNNARNFSKPKGPSINRRPKPKRKANKSLVLIMIVALIAFVIGAGIGVSLSLDDGSDDGPHYQNVTKEMTSNLNETDEAYIYNDDIDRVDYNENDTTLTDIGYEVIEN